MILVSSSRDYLRSSNGQKTGCISARQVIGWGSFSRIIEFTRKNILESVSGMNTICFDNDISDNMTSGNKDGQRFTRPTHLTVAEKDLALFLYKPKRLNLCFLRFRN